MSCVCSFYFVRPSFAVSLYKYCVDETSVAGLTAGVTLQVTGNYVPLKPAYQHLPQKERLFQVQAVGHVTLVWAETFSVRF
jgi:hypothetical protein